MLDRDTELEIVRRAYAKQVMAAAGVTNRRVEAAFAAVRREEFLGKGPWPIVRWGRGYVPTPSRNPVYLYDNVLVGILPERNLNNGEPAFLASLIAAAAPKPGEHAVHIGAGVGYYTAILAHLVGRGGRVTAIEYDPVLAVRLAQNLRTRPNVAPIQGDGAQVEFGAADVILVNAGATRPADRWLDGLAEGGRLILPLTTAEGSPPRAGALPYDRRGAVFLIARLGADFAARWISGVGIYPCHGMREAASERALQQALATEGRERVTRLYRHADIPDEKCWLKAPDWCLAYA